MTAYYNEIDPFAAAWLRELIKHGHIAPGEVDERSITDVRAADLLGYRQVHFFAGIGGWSLAARLAGIPDDYPLWTGSAPCQPFSSAGKQRGTDDERHLWPIMRDLVAQCRPAVVAGEQVASRLGLDWLASVRADLEAEGYAVGAADLCAASVGAPHVRQRLYWGGVRLADSVREGLERRIGSVGDPIDENEQTSARRGATHLGDGLRLADAGSAAGRRDAGAVPRAQTRVDCERLVDGIDYLGHRDGRAAGGVADADCERRDGIAVLQEQRETVPQGARGGCVDRMADAGRQRDERWAELGVQPSTKGQAQTQARQQQRGGADGGSCGDGVRVADAGRERSKDWLSTKGYRDGGHTEESWDGGDRWPGGSSAFTGSRSGAAHGGWSDLDWLFCRDGKWRPVESGTFPLAHGIPARVGRLRGYGNAIVPQVAAAFLRALLSAGVTP